MWITRLFCLALLVAAVPLAGSSISADGSYHEFSFGVAGSFAVSCGGTCEPTVNPVAENTSSPPWTFSGPATVFVLDLFNVGDEFALYDNNVLVGETSMAASNTLDDPCNNDIACAAANSEYSRGAFNLGSGSHSLTIEAIQNAFDTSTGAAVFSVGPTVPEPASGLLVLTGLVGAASCISFRGRRRTGGRFEKMDA